MKLTEKRETETKERQKERQKDRKTERKVGRDEGKKESKKMKIQRQRDLQIDRQRYRNVASTVVFLGKNLDISFFSSTRRQTSGTTANVPDVRL